MIFRALPEITQQPRLQKKPARKALNGYVPTKKQYAACRIATHAEKMIKESRNLICDVVSFLYLSASSFTT